MIGNRTIGPFTVTVAVTSGSSSGTQTFLWTVNPVVSVTAIADQTSAEGDTISMQASATDANSSTLTYSATGLPAGLSINAGTGLISGIISTGDASAGPDYPVTVTASDGTYSTSVTFNWHVTNPSNTAPTLTNPGDHSNQVGDSVDFFLTASDADGDPLTFSATGLPDGLNIDPYSGELWGTLAEDSATSAPQAVTVTVDDGQGGTATQTLNWVVSPDTLTVTASSISAVEGQGTGLITVATFTTPDLNCQAGDFTAIVNYSDGASDVGTVDGGNGSFTVSDDHTFAEEGNYTFSVAISDLYGASEIVSATGNAIVTNSSLCLSSAVAVSALVNQQMSLSLGAFTNNNPNSSPSDFSLSIAWGDGSTSNNVTINPEVGGLYRITGQHTYTACGTYTATLTVTDADGASGTTTCIVNVGNLYAWVNGTLNLTSFTDANPSATSADFSVTINWGDGQTSTGTVSQSGSNFTVTGSHSFAVDSVDQTGGVYNVSLTVTDDGGSTLTKSLSVEVVRPPISLVMENVAFTPGVALNNVELASFTEPDLTDPNTEFSVSINWGDATTPTAGTVTGSNGTFRIFGSHTYATAGSYDIQVIPKQAWTGMVPMGSVSALAQPPQKPKLKPGVTNVYEFEGFGGVGVNIKGIGQVKLPGTSAILKDWLQPIVEKVQKETKGIANIHFYGQAGIIAATKDINDENPPPPKGQAPNKIVLVGYSAGGDSVIRIAAKLEKKRINLAFTVDPVPVVRDPVFNTVIGLVGAINTSVWNLNLYFFLHNPSKVQRFVNFFQNADKSTWPALYPGVLFKHGIWGVSVPVATTNTQLLQLGPAGFAGLQAEGGLMPGTGATGLSAFYQHLANNGHVVMPTLAVVRDSLYDEVTAVAK